MSFCNTGWFVPFKTKFTHGAGNKKALTNRLAFLLIIFQSCGRTASPLFQQAWVGEGSQPSLHARARRWASDCGLVLAERWLRRSSASRAKEKPSQWERSPSIVFCHSQVIFIYVFAFSHADGQHQWLRAVVCIPEPSKSSCPGSAFKRAGLPMSTWAVAISAKWVARSTSFQQ